MNNQDMPASPQSRQFGKEYHMDFDGNGETKREKAFWQVYSAMLAHPQTEVDSNGGFDGIANDAIEAVNAGFKALESE